MKKVLDIDKLVTSKECYEQIQELDRQLFELYYVQKRKSASDEILKIKEQLKPLYQKMNELQNLEKESQ